VILVDRSWLIEHQVSQTIRVPADDGRWAMGEEVVADGYGYKVKGVLSDGGGTVLVTLVRWSAVDEDAAKEPHA
jgi:hypothetical protein